MMMSFIALYSEIGISTAVYCADLGNLAHIMIFTVFFFCVTGCEYLTHYVLYIYSQIAECGGTRVLHQFTIDRVRGHG